VAGACVTVLKAWVADGSFVDVINAAARPGKDPGPPPAILQPGSNNPDGSLPPYAGADRGEMTVHGELNKLAANVAMARAMGVSTGAPTTPAACVWASAPPRSCCDG
jgi:hypothetical protein